MKLPANIAFSPGNFGLESAAGILLAIVIVIIVPILFLLGPSLLSNKFQNKGLIYRALIIFLSLFVLFIILMVITVILAGLQ